MNFKSIGAELSKLLEFAPDTKNYISNVTNLVFSYKTRGIVSKDMQYE